jgi:hypothetical protein
VPSREPAIVAVNSKVGASGSEFFEHHATHQASCCRTEAIVRSMAKGKDWARRASDIKVGSSGSELPWIPIRRGIQKHDFGLCGYHLLVQLNITSGGASKPLHGAAQAKQLGDCIGNQIGLLHK